MALVPNPNDYPSGRKDKPTKKAVVENTVEIADRSIISKFWNVFQLKDLGEIKGYIFEDLIVPGFKKAVRGVVDIILDGEVRSYSKVNTGGTHYINYNKIEPSRDRALSKEPNRPNRDFRLLEYVDRIDAERVKKELLNDLATYGQATVASLYEASGITPYFTDYKYGWTNLEELSVRNYRGKYILDLPKAEPLE